MKELMDIPGYQTWKTIELVDKGWSSDKKYHIFTENDDELLLRLSDHQSYDQKIKEFDFIKKLSQVNIVMTSAIEMGQCQEGVFTLLTWLKGQALEEVIASLTIKEQYKLGLEAGKTLASIHNIPCEQPSYSWEKRFNAKMDRKIDMYKACPLKYENGQAIIDYIEGNRHLLKGRSMSYQHGDYHIGNMIYTRHHEVGIIDFNRWDIGDPWEEFNRIVWDIDASPAFAAGRIDGYFDHQVPDEFFGLLAIYIASNTLSSLPWAMDFGQKEVDTMVKQTKNILAYYQNFSIIVPSWYSEIKGKL